MLYLFSFDRQKVLSLLTAVAKSSIGIVAGRIEGHKHVAWLQIERSGVIVLMLPAVVIAGYVFTGYHITGDQTLMQHCEGVRIFVFLLAVWGLLPMNVTHVVCHAHIAWAQS